MPYCKDCVYFLASSPREPSCTAPQYGAEPDPVWGNTKYLLARTVRAEQDWCGPDGRWFELRPAPPPRWWRRLLGR
jgi:hypothetical protein